MATPRSPARVRLWPNPEPAMSERARRTRDAALVAGPALLAAALCLYRIDGRSLGFDEGATVAIASQHGAALRSAIGHDGGNMAGYYVLLHALIDLFGSGQLVLRLPSAIGAALAVALVQGLAVRLFDRPAALASGILAAVSLPLVFWGQGARSYALLVALSAGSFLALALVMQGARPRVAWTAYVLCTALAVYASLMALLIVPAQLVLLLWYRRRWTALVSALVAVAICCIPLAVLAARRGAGQLFWVPRPDAASVKQVAEALTSAGLEPNFHATSTTVPLLVVTLAALVVSAIAALRPRADWRPADTDRRSRAQWRPAPVDWRPVLIVSWLTVPVALAVIESFVGQPIFLPRNLLMCVPAAALLLGWGITRPRVPRLAAWAAVAALVALRALQLAPSYGVSPEDWRAATTHVIDAAAPGDCMAFYPTDGRNVFRYYVRGRRAPRPLLPPLPFSVVRAYVEDYATLSARQLSRLPASCPRVWLVSSHQGQPNGTRGSRANWNRYLALRRALASRYARDTASSFGYAAPVDVDLFAR